MVGVKIRMDTKTTCVEKDVELHVCNLLMILDVIVNVIRKT